MGGTCGGTPLALQGFGKTGLSWAPGPKQMWNDQTLHKSSHEKGPHSWRNVELGCGFDFAAACHFLQE